MSDDCDKVTTDDLIDAKPSRESVQDQRHLPHSDTNAEDCIRAVLDAQDREAEEYTRKFLTAILRLRGVHIDREQFLKTELHKRGIGKNDITRAIKDSPAAAGVSPTTLDDMAKSSIDFERNKATTLSFATGLPGGFAIFATIPGDLTQFYVHTFRIMQKLAYIYGWQAFLENTENIDDETLGKLSGFLGIMMGVAGAAGALRHFTFNIARPALNKNIAKIALTKTAWYLPMKQTLRVVGVHVTKQSFAQTATKVVPLFGGMASGGLTYVTFNTQSKRLMKYLRRLVPPNVEASKDFIAVRNKKCTQQ